ncbi:MAG: hypothetical protein ACQEXJ_20655 [Myxococcota bacterium]
MSRARTVAGGVLGLVACALALTGPAPAGPALLLGVASAAAAGGLLALPMGALALALALAQSTARVPDPMLWAGVVAAGLAVGFVARRAERALPWLIGPRAQGTGVLLCGLALVACVLPDDTVRLFTADGAPLALEVVTGDPERRSMVRTAIPAVVPHPPPLAGALPVLAWVAPFVAWLLLAVGASGEDRWRRPAWSAALVLGALMVVAGAAGLAELVGGTVSLPSEDALRRILSERMGGAAAVVPVDPPAEGHLTLASRPLVDALRLVTGALLGALAFVRLRRPSPTDVELPSVGGPELPLGLALATAGIALLAPAPVAWTLGAGAVLGGGALIGGLLGGAERRLSHDLVLLALMVWVAALGPWTGWVSTL